MAKTLKFLVLSDRLELYKDFAINLLYCVYDYYLDYESFKDAEDGYNHFSWCFKKVSNKFEEENFNFSTNKDLHKYLYQFYKIHFYENVDLRSKEDINLKLYIEMWNDLFDLNNKDNDLVKTLIELYSIFDKTLTNANNKLELV